MIIRIDEKMCPVLTWRRKKLYCGKQLLAEMWDSRMYHNEYRLRQNALLHHHTTNGTRLRFVHDAIRIADLEQAKLELDGAIAQWNKLHPVEA